MVEMTEEDRDWLWGAWTDSFLSAMARMWSGAMQAQAESNVGDDDDLRSMVDVFPEVQSVLHALLRTFFGDKDESVFEIFEGIIVMAEDAAERLGIEKDIVRQVTGPLFGKMKEDYAATGSGGLGGKGGLGKAEGTGAVLGLLLLNGDERIIDEGVSRKDLIGLPIPSLSPRMKFLLIWTCLLTFHVYQIILMDQMSKKVCAPATKGTSFVRDITNVGWRVLTRDWFGPEPVVTVTRTVGKIIIDDMTRGPACEGEVRWAQAWLPLKTMVAILHTGVFATEWYTGRIYSACFSRFFEEEGPEKKEVKTPPSRRRPGRSPRRSSPRRTRRTNAQIGGNACSVCGGDAEHVCGGCEKEVYCSMHCQSVDWTGGHALTCDS